MATLPARFGRFDVVDELGRGAMGVVYRARDAALGREVAIKSVTLPGDEQERDQHERRFLQEARAAGSITHPSIVTIYDVGREGDVAFMAMELVHGREIRDLLLGGRLAPADAARIAAQVADGLAHAHERGIIHRDIKPSNIMVLDDGRAKIMDFGIARLAEPTVKTQTGMMLGSPQYMSPEQIGGQEVDGRSDIFSLGLVLYEMLTGTRPFGGQDLAQLMFNVANIPARPPTHLVPELPAVLDYIVARALRKSASERYPTAAEFARDLREALPQLEGNAPGVAATTVPMPGGDPGAPLAKTVPLPEARGALPVSPRFDSSEGLARLAVLPDEDEAVKSRAGWTVTHVRPEKAPASRRREWLLYAAALVVAMLIVVGCSPRGPRVERLAEGSVVLAFGDSLTHGTGAAPAEAYPAVLERLIGRTVVNAGVPGETSAEGLVRLPGVLDEVKPGLLILCHGGNDFLRKLGDERAAANVRSMIAEARSRGIPVVLLATPKPTLPPSIPAFYGEIAAAEKVPFEEGVMRSVLLDNRLKSDLVHPNAQGYAKIAAALDKLLRAAGAV